MMYQRMMVALLCLTAVLGSLCLTNDVLAASDETPGASDSLWPPVTLAPAGTKDVNTIDRGPGWYLSIVKIIFFWLLFLLWVKTTDWINRDCQTHRLNYMQWNSIAVFPFFIAVLLTWILPYFGIGFILMVLAYAGSVGAYVFTRNQAVEDHKRVLTPEHLRFIFSKKAQKIGVKVDAEKKAVHETGAPVEFKAQGGAQNQDDAANLLTAKQAPGFVPAKELFAEAANARSEVVMLDFTAEAVNVRHQIDGVWHAAPARDRMTGDGILWVYKKLAALNVDERVARQEGKFLAVLNGRKWVCRMLSQGTATGERVVVKLDSGAVDFNHFTELGMREKVAEQFLPLMNDGEGLVLLSAMPAGGMSALMHVTLEECDRLMRNFVGIEEERVKEIDVENVEIKTYQAAKGQTPLSVLPEVLKSYPEVLVIPTLPDGPTVNTLCAEVRNENRTVLSTVRAKEATEAILRVLMLKPVPAEYAEALKAVLNVRLIRKLCTECKVAFEPPAELRQKLGIPADRVPHLYREPTAEERQHPCATCGGVGYFGRTGLFELLVVSDKVREVIVRQPKLDLLKKAARMAGMKTLQEEGILLVAKGETSVQELMRILKQ